MIIDTIPQELRNRPQWVVWELRQQRGGGKPRKVPLQVTGAEASSTDSNTWTTFDSAYAAFIADNRFAGIGYMFAAEDPYTGVDLDGCIVDGKLSEETKKIAIKLNSYTERSQSGTGIHIIVKAAKPGTKCKNTKAGFEMYDKERFFIVTGDHVAGSPLTIEPRQAEINALYDRMFDNKKEDRQMPAPNSSDLNDLRIISLAQGAKNGEKFISLYSGNWSGYGSQSEADQALCNIIAFYTQDAEQIDRIFRSSGLFRDKWERPDYSGETIRKAIELALENKAIRQEQQQQQRDSIPKFDTGDKGNAERLVHLFADRMRHCAGSWFTWDGKRWKRDETNAVFLLAQKVSEFIDNEEIAPIMASLDDYDRMAIKMFQKKDLTPEQLETKGILESLRKQAERAKSDQGIRAMIAQAAPVLSVSADEMNPDDGFINVENGLLRWQTGELLPHSSGRFSTALIPVTYNPAADCPQIKKFLTDVLPADSIPAMVEFFGYSLIPSARYKKATLLTGGGNNGKSKLLDLYTLFIGSENQSNIPLQDLEHNRFAKAQLYGKLANVCADIPPTRLESSDTFKKVVSGDGMEAEYKGRDSFRFKPFAKLIFSANEKPASRDLTEGFFNRWLIFDFPNKFVPGVNADPFILEKISSPSELSGLLNLALNALHRLTFNGGFKVSDSMKAQVEEYQNESDPTIQFIEECCEVHNDNTRVSALTLYNVFQNWSRENGYSHPMTNTAFGRKMSARFQKIRSNGSYYVGLSIRHDVPRYPRSFYG